MRASNTIAAVIMLLSALLLQGCGRKGPLYLQQMPVAPAAVASQPAAAASQPGAAQSAVIPTTAIQNPTDTTIQP